MKTAPTNEQAILAQVQREYASGYAFVAPKREKFRTRLRMYNLADVPEDKVAINTLYTTIQTLLAGYLQDRPSVTFEPREAGDAERADALNLLAKYDYSALEGGKMDYQVQWDRLFYGVGIRVLTVWDDERQMPLFEAKDPLSWIPDPNATSPNDFLFCGFEGVVDKNSLCPEKGYINQGKILSETEEQEARSAAVRRKSRLLGDTSTSLSGKDGQMASIYNHFTILNGEKYLVTLANSRTLIIRCQKLAPIGENEKKDASSVPFPVILNHYSPLRGDPFGVSVPDLLEDKQRAHSVLANLELLKEKLATLGGNFLYDVNMIPNKHELATSTIGPKFIGVDGARGSLSQAVIELPRPQNSSSTQAIISTLNQEIEFATGVDPSQTGVRTDGSMTATESQQLQANANLRILLSQRVNSWGEVTFWKLWYRAYVGCFDETQKKILRLTGDSETKWKSMSRGDFIANAHPDIVITLTSEYGNQKATELRSFLGVYPLIFDASTHPLSLVLAKRKLLRLSGLDESEIRELLPPSVDELDAEQDLELLNKNIPVEIHDFDEDHFTYLTVYARSDDTPAKFAAIEARKKALIAQRDLAQKPVSETTENTAAKNIATNVALSDALHSPAEIITRGA